MRCLWQLDPTYFDALLYDFNGFTKGYDAKEIMTKVKCPIFKIAASKNKIVRGWGEWDYAMKKGLTIIG